MNIQSHETTWMELEGTVLNETSHTERQLCHDLIPVDPSRVELTGTKQNGGY